MRNDGLNFILDRFGLPTDSFCFVRLAYLKGPITQIFLSYDYKLEFVGYAINNP